MAFRVRGGVKDKLIQSLIEQMKKLRSQEAKVFSSRGNINGRVRLLILAWDSITLFVFAGEEFLPKLLGVLGTPMLS